MRLVSILTSLVVALALYALIFERDRLLSLAGVDPSEDAAQLDAASGTPAPASKDDESASVAVVAIESAAATVGNSVPLRGQTEATRKIDVKSQISGLIESEPLRKGSFVKTGDVLCKVDPGTRPAQLAEAQARLAEAQIGDTAAAKLAEGGFGSETRAVSARAALQSAQAAIELAETEIARLTITAPFGGVLETDTAELGSLMQPGEACATILQLDPIRIVAFMPETAVNVVKVGASATARLSSGQVVDGTVTFLSRSADPETRTFRVEITAENPDLAIRDGQSADIEIAAAGVSAHLVPQSALTLNDDGEMGLRLVEPDNMVSFAPVRIVRDTTQGVYVTGLPDSAKVIVVGQEFVRRGVKVDVTLRGAGG